MNNSLSFALKNFFDYQMKGVWTVLPCIAISDLVEEELRIDVQPLIDGLYDDGTVERRPPIYSVPVQMPATANSLVYIPVQQGDILLCVFAQRSLDNFKAGTGEFQEPSDYRRFDKRDAIAIPGIFPFKQAVTARRTIPSDPKSLSLTNNVGTPQEVTVQLTPSGDVVIKSPAKVLVDSPNTTFTGDASVQGSTIVDGNISSKIAPSSVFITPLGQVATISGGQLSNITDGVTGIINLDYYAELENSIDKIQDCASLQAKAEEIVENFNKETEAITETIDKVAPIAALLDPPTDPGEVVTWVSDFISGFLTPLAAPATTLPAQLAARTTAMTAVLAKIAEKQDEIPSCSVTPPPVTP